MAVSADLNAMFQRLARLPAAERDLVLGQLEPGQQDRLFKLFAESGRIELSPALKQLIGLCKQGETPAGLTPRAAAALIKSARVAETSAEPAAAAGGLAGLTGMLQRFGLGG